MFEGAPDSRFLEWYSRTTMQIFAFGASIVYGAFDEEGGWVDRLKQFVYQQIDAHPDPDYWVEVYNLGIPGQRSDHLLKRFAFETEQRISEEAERKIFLISLGANDAAFVPSLGRFKVSVDEYKRNLQEVIAQAKRFSPDIVLLTITPVNELVTTKAEKDKIRKNEFVERYNEAIKEVAEEMSVALIDVYSAYKERGANELLCEDGLHPNAEGHKVIFELAKDYVAGRL